MHIRQPSLFVTLLSLGGCTLADLDPGHVEAVEGKFTRCGVRP